MKTLQLTRVEQTAVATFGVILDERGKDLCVTLELAWHGNEHDVSCIPAGTYAGHCRHSPKRGYPVPELLHVPGRENIEMHRGNTPGDSLGCILLGSRFGIVNGQRGITGSAEAFERFMHYLGDEPFELVIVDPAPLAA